MAKIIIVGSIAQDDVVHLREPMREGAHIEGVGRGMRLGGGAPNTAMPLARAHHRVFVVAAIGRDDAGRRLTTDLEDAGVDISLVRTLDGAATTRSIIMVDETGERTIVNLARTAEQEPPVRILKTPADWLYVRSRATDLAPILERKAADCKIMAHIPPCGDDARPAHVLIGSQSDLPPDILDNPLGAGRKIGGDLVEWVVITRGPKGARAYGDDGEINVRATKVAPVDSTGAGDSFAAGLLHGLASEKPMNEAMKIAAAWGAESVKWACSGLPAEAMKKLL
ncbi:MAG: carbohydrate kinase family protein [Rhodospirillales bacterium]|jgi:sugar/nucleoside kinase (ribokinase family)|nr:carbohydrate kinase family protein [Rhodospirillales bacterium]